MSGWQPIETAPKDGTPVMLCYAPGGHILWLCAAEWGSASPGYTRCASYSGWFHKLPLTTDPAFGPGEYAPRGDVLATVHFPPTHWMPLPEPPA